MNTLLKVNLTTRIAIFEDEAWAPDAYVYGEDIPLACRLTETVDGVEQPFLDDVIKVRAYLGERDARSESGTWSLQVGSGVQTADNTATDLQANGAASALQAAINAKTAITGAHGTAKVTLEAGTYVIVFGDGEEEVELQIRDNKLFPRSWARFRSYQDDDGVWHHAIRLTRLPLVTIKAGDTGEPAVQRVLPPRPTIVRKYIGTGATNELQILTVPKQFNGSYVFVISGVRTSELTQQSGASEIQSALEEQLGTGNVKVSEQANSAFFVEYIGELAQAAHAVPTIDFITVPLGDVTFALGLRGVRLAQVLDVVPSFGAPLEVWMETKDADDVVTKRVAFIAPLTIGRPVGWEELDIVDDINWSVPTSPKDFKLYDSSNIITGQQFDPVELGDGAATSFPINHGLNTRLVFVWVTENHDGGRQLTQDVDFRVNITNANTVTVTSLVGAPANDAWEAIVLSAQTVAAFAAGLMVNIDQVIGLETRLAAAEAAITALQAYIPAMPPSAAASTDKINITLPLVTAIFPGVFPDSFDYSGAKTKLTGLRAAPRLFGAVHKAAVVNISTVLVAGALPAASTQANKVFTNDTAGWLADAPPGGLIASDGRDWYRVLQDGVTTSYFPQRYERELWRLNVSKELLRAGQTLDLSFGFLAQLLKANCKARINLRLQFGAYVQDTTPGTPARNLASVNWNDATPLFDQVIDLGPTATPGTFGATIARAADDTFVTQALRYGAYTVSAANPANTDFALRALLLHFDTANAPTDARGFVYFESKPGAINVL